MSIEERLEAITHTLELVAHMQRDSEARFERQIERTNAKLAETNDTVREIGALLASFTKEFAAVIAEHEVRIQRLERLS